MENTIGPSIEETNSIDINKLNTGSQDSIDKLYEIFDRSQIEIKITSKQKYGDLELVEYTATYSGPPYKNKCFTIVVAPKYISIVGIKYENETNCLLSGNSILEKIETFARNIGVSFISLNDGSQIYIDEFRSYSLSVYYILLHGVSWYNAKGYISKKTEDEKTNNKKIIETSMNVVPQIVSNKLYSSVVNALKVYGIQESETLGGIMQKLDGLRKEEIYGYELMKTIKMYVDLVKSSGILQYDISLRKDIKTLGGKRSRNKTRKTKKSAKRSRNRKNKTLYYK